MSYIALNTAATGLSALSTSLDVTANNLANANTTGFKSSRGNFEDLYYQELAQPGIASGALVMLVHPSVPARTLPEFIAYAKANPTKLNYSTPGMGTDPHLSAEMLKMLAGIEMAHVPYRGGALALTDLIAGNVQVMFSNLPVGEFIRTGKLVGLGTTGLVRNPEFPDLPPIAETVPNYEVGVWYGYVARRGTPDDIVAKLNGALVAGLADPAVTKGISTLNAEPMRTTPAEFDKHVQAEQDRWGKVIKAANIRLN